MSAYVPPGEWAGLPHERPGLLMRKDAVAALEPEEDAEPVGPGVVLFNRTVDSVAELIRLCPPAKLALGAVKRKDGTVTMIGGGLGPGWAFVARHGAGYQPATGRFAESVALRLAHPDGRSALFVWARPVPDPRLMHAVSHYLMDLAPRVRMGAERAETYPGPYVVGLPAVLATLKASEWKSVGAWRWTRDADERPDDIPDRAGSTVIKKEVRS